MKILVTGGAGFIGSHLCQRLAKEGNEVTCMDNLLSGKKENVEGIGVKFVEHDIIEPFEWKGDMIFNMACPASPIFYQNYPLETLETNSQGMKNVLECALKNDATIVQASTSEVYGNPKEHPQKETYWGNVNPNGIRSCYDEGKRYAESLCMNYLKLNGVKVQIARIFNTYGTRMRLDDGRVTPNFIKQAIKGENLTVYGDGKQTRSFCYVDDLVDGLLRLSRYAEYGSVVNLGNPIEYTVLEAAQIIKECCNSASELSFELLPSDDPVKRQPDITRAKELLGWKPKISFREGIEHSLPWFREEIK